MGEVIKKNAAIDRVEADVLISDQRARERGGDIADAAVARLGAAVESINNAKAMHAGAEAAEQAAWTVVLAREDEGEVALGGIRDEMWNALGRPRTHPAMNHVFPGGVGTYTSAKPEDEPVMMQVLSSRIRTADAPQWATEQRDEWIARVEAVRAPLAAAVDAHRPHDAALTVATATRRAAARYGHSKLTAFKRDLKNLGQTEAQIHTIIPDRSSTGGGGGGAPTPNE